MRFELGDGDGLHIAHHSNGQNYRLFSPRRPASPRGLPPAPHLYTIAISMIETARRPQAGTAAGGRAAAASSQGTWVPGFFVPRDGARREPGGGPGQREEER